MLFLDVCTAGHKAIKDTMHKCACLFMLSQPLPSQYRHRFSHRRMRPAFQIRILQRWYIPKKQKGRNFENFVVSCSYCKQAVGRYCHCTCWEGIKGLCGFVVSLGHWGKDQVAVLGCCLSAPMSCCLCSGGGCGVLWGGHLHRCGAHALMHCILLLFHWFVSSLASKLRRLLGLHQLSLN